MGYITPWIRYDDHERTRVFRRGLKVPCCPLQDLWAGNMRRCMCTGKNRREKGWAEENESWDGERNITKDFCVASGHNEMALKLQQVYGVLELLCLMCVEILMCFVCVCVFTQQASMGPCCGHLPLSAAYHHWGGHRLQSKRACVCACVCLCVCLGCLFLLSASPDAFEVLVRKF